METVTPLTSERIFRALNAEGIKFEINDMGKAVAKWQEFILLFGAEGDDQELMCMWGCWNQEPIQTHKSIFLNTINEWNRDVRWPTAYIDEDGDVCVSESVLLAAGATDQQIQDILSSWIATAAKLFTDKLS